MNDKIKRCLKSPIPTPTIQRHMNIRYLAFIVLIFVGFITIVAAPPCRWSTMSNMQRQRAAIAWNHPLDGQARYDYRCDSVVLAVSEDVYN